jgi:hypothetical protein
MGWKSREEHRARVAALVGTMILAASPLWALDEVQVYGIAQFGGSGQCGDSDMTHTVHTSTAFAFRTPFDLMKLIGLWDQTASLNNSSAHSKRWSDSSKATGGSDTETNAGADEPDVIYVHTHGSHSESSPARTSLSMGKSGSGFACSAETDTHMLWNSDLDIAVIKACQSGDYDTWLNGGYRQQFTRSGSPFRMWNAFHGDSSCGSHVTSYVGAYASESFFNGVGENWLDEAYDVDSGTDDDDCPVSIVMGDSQAKRVNLFENGGWLDRKDTGAKTGSTIFYFKGCDPKNGRKLPTS